MCYVSSRHQQERHGLTVDDEGDDNRDKYGYYKCRGPCSLVFATNKFITITINYNYT